MVSAGGANSSEERPRKAESLRKDDPYYLIRVMPAEGNRPAGLLPAILEQVIGRRSAAQPTPTPPASQPVLSACA